MHGGGVVAGEVVSIECLQCISLLDPFLPLLASAWAPQSTCPSPCPCPRTPRPDQSARAAGTLPTAGPACHSPCITGWLAPHEVQHVLMPDACAWRGVRMCMHGLAHVHAWVYKVRMPCHSPCKQPGRGGACPHAASMLLACQPLWPIDTQMCEAALAAACPRHPCNEPLLMQLHPGFPSVAPAYHSSRCCARPSGSGPCKSGAAHLLSCHWLWPAPPAYSAVHSAQHGVVSRCTQGPLP